MERKYANADDMLYGLTVDIHQGQAPVVRTPSRAGEVLRVDEPVMVTLHYPHDCIVFNKGRDANPFFHLYEALWMLAGRSDVASLAFYNSRIGEIASDDGTTFRGCYGYRWRAHFRFDQLDLIIRNLADNPHDRRQVLNHWDTGYDLRGAPRYRDTKDVPCNTQVMFQLRDEDDEGPDVGPRLDMFVVNRSNDMIWGLTGANVVHFSFLLQYVAAALGVRVGSQTHTTFNLHVYTERWNPEAIITGWQTGPTMTDTPLFVAKRVFDQELQKAVDVFKGDYGVNTTFTNWFLENVAKPMFMAYRFHKRRDYATALDWLDRIDTKARAWRLAGKQWIEKRYANWKKGSKD